VYLSHKYHSLKNLLVVPVRVTLKLEGAQVLVATDMATGTRLTYALAQIERARSTERRG
jgi:hypothetical protein